MECRSYSDDAGVAILCFFEYDELFRTFLAIYLFVRVYHAREQQSYASSTAVLLLCCRCYSRGAAATAEQQQQQQHLRRARVVPCTAVCGEIARRLPMDPPSPPDRSDFECAQYFRRLMDYIIPEIGKTPLWAACLLMGESRLGSKPACKIENSIRAKRCCTSACTKAVLYVHRGTPVNSLGTSNGSGTPDGKKERK